MYLTGFRRPSYTGNSAHPHSSPFKIPCPTQIRVSEEGGWGGNPGDHGCDVDAEPSTCRCTAIATSSWSPLRTSSRGSPSWIFSSSVPTITNFTEDCKFCLILRRTYRDYFHLPAHNSWICLHFKFGLKSLPGKMKPPSWKRKSFSKPLDFSRTGPQSRDSSNKLQSLSRHSVERFTPLFDHPILPASFRLGSLLFPFLHFISINCRR